MKILWVGPNFLHPTTKGGQIRTLEMLRHLHRRHEVHYVAFANAAHPEALEQASEYSARAYAVPHRVPKRPSPAFLAQSAANLFSTLPLPVSRYRSKQMTAVISELRRRERFDSVVCDYLFPAPNFEWLDGCVLFEHNVETVIWLRQAEAAGNPVSRRYHRMLARRMRAYEGRVCRNVARVIAVSPVDAEKIREMFGIAAADVPTGVDLEFFAPPAAAAPSSELVFVGSMDWMPNIDGVEYFAKEIFPLIRTRRPGCTLAVVGRTPPPRIARLADTGSGIRVTGTVPDIRPYLWGASVSIVPLRIGSGTRLKIYESMAAGAAVVSTAIGAEGLEVHPPADIRIADSPQEFARACLELLEDPGERRRMSHAAMEMVKANFSWEQVTRRFEEILTSTPCGAGS